MKQTRRPSYDDDLPTLTVAVATIGKRLFQLDLAKFTPVPGVTYHVFAQGLSGNREAQAYLTDVFTRADLRVNLVDGVGAARNRNAAIATVESDLLLFADDDTELLQDNYSELRRRFRDDAALGFVCGRIVDETGAPRKSYGRDGRRVHRFNCAKVGTPELAVRVSPVRSLGLRFDETFGAGTPLWLGDEYIFLTDCLRRGLKGQHIALNLAVHPQESSGSADTATSFEVRRAVLRRALGGIWYPAAVAFAVKNWRRFPSWAEWFRFVRPFG